MKLIQSVPCLFEHQATRFPQKYAVSMGENRLTYTELNEKANQLAHYLCSLKDCSIPFIPLFLDKSEKSILSILAVLKAGMAYIPISPEATSLMIDSILINSEAQYIISDSIGAEQLKEKKVKLIDLDKLQNELKKFPKANLLNKPLASDCAYAIYTSGTTGHPKGVLVTHNNLLNTYNSWEEAYCLTEHDVHLQMANVAFDVFVGDYLRALGSGAELVLCPKEIMIQPQRLLELIRNKEITCAEFIPAVLRNLLAYLKNKNHLIDQMRLLICGSDLWTMREFREAKKLFHKNTRIINSYGLTEATIDSTYFEEDDNTFADADLVPVGRPFSHVTLYVLDEQLNALVQEIGEIYIGGSGVASGYLGQEELTKERFVFHPITQERLYKTGDLGRFKSDGTLELLGRNQSHIKINGNRVELLTLESILNQHPKINFSIVSSQSKNNKTELLCFILTEDDSLTVEELNTYILAHLPRYYIPKKIYRLEELSLTQNGKVDRSSAAQKIKAELKPNVAPPKNQMEFDILDLWKRHLDLDELGINHHFYEVGGTSIHLVDMISELNQRYQLHLNYCTASLTIKDLAKQVAELITNNELIQFTE